MDLQELAASDPGFTLSYLAHTLLFVNNLSFNGSSEQKKRFIPRCASGEMIGGMGMSEPGAGAPPCLVVRTALWLRLCGGEY
jgi:isovaleryl-CoA dehydrogenase